MPQKFIEGNFSDRIKQARKAKGFTQAQLASACGLATGTIQQYELGTRNPTRKNLLKISNALGLAYEYDSNGVAFFFELPPIEPKAYGEDNFFDSLLATSQEIEKIIKEIKYSQTFEQLHAAFDQLNPAGQEKAVERVEELTEIPKYQLKPENSVKNVRLTKKEPPPAANRKRPTEE